MRNADAVTRLAIPVCPCVVLAVVCPVEALVCEDVVGPCDDVVCPVEALVCEAVEVDGLCAVCPGLCDVLDVLRVVCPGLCEVVDVGGGTLVVVRVAGDLEGVLIVAGGFVLAFFFLSSSLVVCPGCLLRGLRHVRLLAGTDRRSGLLRPARRGWQQKSARDRNCYPHTHPIG